MVLVELMIGGGVVVAVVYLHQSLPLPEVLGTTNGATRASLPLVVATTRTVAAAVKAAARTAGVVSIPAVAAGRKASRPL
jgi:hypothetical protein